jgi:hypothetical protein
LDKLPKEEFYLAVLGLFKRGKSTLINAVLSRAILPTGVIPVTSVITRIRYGNDLKVKIGFSDGSEEDVPIEDLREYVTEEGNPNNTKKVTIADILVPSQILKDGLILIDTPGVGSTYLSGTKITFQFLDRVDFAIFVLAVDPPVGQQELELLSTLTSKSNRILFILNKIDYVDPTAVAESVRYCQKVIMEHLEPSLGSALTLYPLSAKLALDGRLHDDTVQIQRSGIEKFETALKESLLNQKENFIIQSAWKKLEKASADLKTYLEVKVNSLRMPLDNLAHLLTEFEQYLEDVEQRKSELFYVFEGRVNEIISMLDEDLTTFKKEYENALVKQVEEFAEERLSSEKTTSKKVATDVDEYLRKTLIEVYSQFIRNEDSKIGSRFQQLVNESNEKMNAIIGDVKQKSAQLFGFETVTLLFNASLSFESRFYYHIDPIFITEITFSGGEIAQLLPKTLFKGILKKKLEERTRGEFDKNGGRIRYDYFITRLNSAVLKLKADINRALESSTETVKRAVQEGKRLRTKSETEVFSSFIVLNKMLGELGSAQLQSIRKQLGWEFEIKREKSQLEFK